MPKSRPEVELVDLFNLNDPADEAPAPEPPAEPEPVVAPEPPRPRGRRKPVSEAELTPEQRRIRDLENQLALERGKKDVEPELDELATPGAEGNIVIHFVAEGFTALNYVWHIGQELEFDPDGAAYQDTCDRNGNSWLDLRDNDFAQIERYGEVKFRSGPWPGKSYEDVASVPFEGLKQIGGDGRVPKPTAAELAQAAAAEARRRRAAPRLPLK